MGLVTDPQLLFGQLLVFSPGSPQQTTALWNVVRLPEGPAKQDLVAKGISEGASLAEFTVKLDSYLNPDFATHLLTSGKVVALGADAYDGSYASQRLLEHEISRAQGSATLQSAAAMGKQILWLLASSHGKPDRCDAHASGGPYAPEDVPPFPDHVNCRCTLATVGKADDGIDKLADLMAQMSAAQEPDEVSAVYDQVVALGPKAEPAPVAAVKPVPLPEPVRPPTSYGAVTPGNALTKAEASQQKSFGAQMQQARNRDTMITNIADRMVADPRFAQAADDHFVATLGSSGPSAAADLRAGLLRDSERLRSEAQLFTENMIDSWAETSARSNTSLMIQIATQQEFGLSPETLWWNAERIQKAMDAEGASLRFYRVFVRAQYEMTQEVLAANNIERVQLVRGVEVNTRTDPYAAYQNHPAPVQLQPLSSMSTSDAVARRFSNKYVFEGTVPAERVMSFYGTGLGTEHESEWVILGDLDEWLARTDTEAKESLDEMWAAFKQASKGAAS
jgi:hypothetical protein